MVTNFVAKFAAYFDIVLDTVVSVGVRATRLSSCTRFRCCCHAVHKWCDLNQTEVNALTLPLGV